MSDNSDDSNDDDESPTTTTPPTDKVIYVDAFDRAHPSTSINAFHIEEDSGRNQRKRDVAARAFQKFGPGSSAEVLHAAGLGGNLNLWRARVAELTNDGVLKKVEERRCRVTNHEVAILQYVPPKDRVRRERVEVRDELILKLCDVLENIVVDNPRLFVGRRDQLTEICDLIASGRTVVRGRRLRQEVPTQPVDVDITTAPT
ncbi:MAG TPA: hypothetical protein VLE97_07050 [Gaiellaceae bacterium]|nr:hypothetical protein [Gaiellaceae bacterium]